MLKENYAKFAKVTEYKYIDSKILYAGRNEDISFEVPLNFSFTPNLIEIKLQTNDLDYRDPISNGHIGFYKGGSYLASPTFLAPNGGKVEFTLANFKMESNKVSITLNAKEVNGVNQTGFALGRTEILALQVPE